MITRCPICGKLQTSESLDPCRCHEPAQSTYWPAFKVRLAIVAGILAIVAVSVLAIVKSPKVLLGVYLLPIGLVAFIGNPDLINPLLLPSYLLYIAIFIGLFTLRGKALLITFIAFCLILLTSLIGCGKILSGVSQIH